MMRMRMTWRRSNKVLFACAYISVRLAIPVCSAHVWIFQSWKSSGYQMSSVPEPVEHFVSDQVCDAGAELQIVAAR